MFHPQLQCVMVPTLLACGYLSPFQGLSPTQEVRRMLLKIFNYLFFRKSEAAEINEKRSYDIANWTSGKLAAPGFWLQ
jgi:hypothetical protein